jgi:hypothetical protein
MKATIQRPHTRWMMKGKCSNVSSTVKKPKHTRKRVYLFYLPILVVQLDRIGHDSTDSFENEYRKTSLFNFISHRFSIIITLVVPLIQKDEKEDIYLSPHKEECDCQTKPTMTMTMTWK